MNEDIIFQERQRFTQWWLWGILFGVSGIIFYGVVQQVIFGIPFGDKPSGDAGLLIVAAIMILMIIMFYSLRLDTIIRQDGIYVQFKPFHTKPRHYQPDQIDTAEVRKYSPLLEYGGWGIRGFGKNIAFNVAGNQGLQLRLSDGRKVLIGTQRPEELSTALRKIVRT